MYFHRMYIRDNHTLQVEFTLFFTGVTISQEILKSLFWSLFTNMNIMYIPIYAKFFEIKNS